MNSYLRHGETGMKNEQHFEFGKNWKSFLKNLTNEKIIQARISLTEMLDVKTLEGQTFLDVGCGSGLFSLAAKQLKVKDLFSFDYDPQSVACAQELKNRYFNGDKSWRIVQGDILKKEFIADLGKWDIVYSWGVLHHTGDMWQALENAGNLVNAKGKLYISIYNDQGWKSKVWRWVKKLYNRTPKGLRFLILIPAFIRLWGPSIIYDFLRLKPFYRWRHYEKNRGMSPWVDVVDWVGGYPFEVAKPEMIVDYYIKKDFTLLKLKTVGGNLGTNQYLFQKY